MCIWQMLFASISYGNFKWLVFQMVWNQKQISANYFPNICPEVKLDWNLDLLYHVNSKFHCNSLVERSFASCIDIPSSTFQNTYVSKTAQKIALLKRALEKHGEAIVNVTGHPENSCEKTITYKDTVLRFKKTNLFNSSSSTSVVLPLSSVTWIKTAWKIISFIWKTVC